MVLLQEIKCKSCDFRSTDYKLYLNPAEICYIHGTGILIRKELVDEYQVQPVCLDGHPEEGRIQMITNKTNFTIINVYVPNSGVDRKQPLRRLDYRLEQWDPDFQRFINNLKAMQGDVILGGDLNVAHRDYDVHDPRVLKGRAGFTDGERQNFSKMLDSGFTDMWDHLYPDSRGNDRFTFNTGWRLDYFLFNDNHKFCIDEMKILLDYCTSDHYPLMMVGSENPPMEDFLVTKA